MPAVPRNERARERITIERPFDAECGPDPLAVPVVALTNRPSGVFEVHVRQLPRVGLPFRCLDRRFPGGDRTAGHRIVIEFGVFHQNLPCRHTSRPPTDGLAPAPPRATALPRASDVVGRDRRGHTSPEPRTVVPMFVSTGSAMTPMYRPTVTLFRRISEQAGRSWSSRDERHCVGRYPSCRRVLRVLTTGVQTKSPGPPIRRSCTLVTTVTRIHPVG